ncbi:MAG: recombinase family protein [Alphaproteobacteria bacterium]|nr:recombinase family protein [Alphaproteobacteria bacterium]
MKPSIKYCAVYTRKSTEEGLDQDFNSLDAQREACLSYVASQKAEGWVPVLDEYNDGGFSGGNLDRPALGKLLEDIKAGKINTVVVYKIDRLTRALMDFSKLVEIFDQYNVTFVSITQSFNTTTSMGRLTLNVLLSFAQFEREVIGERVRDKIAASKKKGMWMGGTVPLGYRVENRQLVPETEEVKTVRHIFDRYLSIGNVNYLQQELEKENICSKLRIYKNGKEAGGQPFSRGALHAFLSNPLYIGKIRHKDKIYEGRHEGVVDVEVWQRAQELLRDNSAIIKGKKQCREINLLKGLLFGEDKVPYSPGYSFNGKRQYRYYISQNVIQQKPHPDHLPRRFPAHEIENLVEQEIRQHLAQRENLATLLRLDEATDYNFVETIIKLQETVPFGKMVETCIDRISVSGEQILIGVKREALLELLSDVIGHKIPDCEGDDIARLEIPYKTWKQKKGSIVLTPENAPKDVLDLPREKLRKLVQGVIWRDEHFGGMTMKDIAMREKCSEAYVGTAIFSGFDILSQKFPAS